MQNNPYRLNWITLVILRARYIHALFTHFRVQNVWEVEVHQLVHKFHMTYWLQWLKTRKDRYTQCVSKKSYAFETSVKNCISKYLDDFFFSMPNISLFYHVPLTKRIFVHACLDGSTYSDCWLNFSLFFQFCASNFFTLWTKTVSARSSVNENSFWGHLSTWRKKNHLNIKKCNFERFFKSARCFFMRTV